MADDLTSQDILGSAPVLDQATLGVVSSLSSQDVLSAVTVVDQPSIDQTHVLFTQELNGGIPVIDAPTFTEIEIEYSVLVDFIETFTVDLIGTLRAVVSWTGDADKEAFISVNGRVVVGPLTHYSTNKSAEVSIVDPFRIEIHEAETASIVGNVLERYPVLHWSRVNDAESYRIYRKRNAAASEERASLVLAGSSEQLFEHRLISSQRQDGGVWNQYRVASILDAKESTGETFPHWVPGLPARPTEIDVSGPYDNLVVELTA